MGRGWDEPVTEHQPADGTTSRTRPGPAAPVSVLDGAGRLRALAESGLTEVSDPGMEYYANQVRSRLGVPVALVSLVQPDQQVFPGMVGLPEPWATRRCTPLSHSFCQYVVACEQPLVIDDATTHPWVRDNLAIAELGVRAYAGIPLTDEAGHVLGSLCAIDVVPRAWSRPQLDTLGDLARSCSLELRLRLSHYDADRERGRRDRLELSLRSAYSRSETLLAVSQSLAQAGDLASIRARLDAIVASDLAPTYIGLVVRGADGLLRRVPSPTTGPGPEDAPGFARFGSDSPLPSAIAVRTNRTLRYPDRASLARDHPSSVTGLVRRLGLHAITVTPLPGHDRPVGALVLGWDEPGQGSPLDTLVITSIAGYLGHAITRAEHLRHRTSVARELQQAMLTALPTVAGMSLGARYQPADRREEVGGDWYDVIALPTPGASGGGGAGFAVTVGDITGHDMHAATVMGQVRSMLRQGAWDHPGRSPGEVLTALERACAGVGLTATGTVVHAHLTPRPEQPGHWLLRWANAGHPPPLYVPADGDPVPLEGHDVLLGYGLLARHGRRTHEVVVEPGSTVFLYTDGLVEQRGGDIDRQVGVLRELLATTVGRDAQEIVDVVLKTLIDDAEDDVVALAISPSAR